MNEIAERIKQEILAKLQGFVEVELKRLFEKEWHTAIVTWATYNVQAFSNENLAELAAVATAEVQRRSGGA